MPKIIAHALTGATIVVALSPKSELNKWTLLGGVLLAISPDLDHGIEWLFNITDVHRGFTHSLIFSFLVGALILIFLDYEKQRLAIAFSLAFLSHTLLDFAASTSGGVKLFWFFSNEYYHLGLTDILESPLGSNLKQVFNWIFIETIIFLPLFLIVILIKKLNG